MPLFSHHRINILLPEAARATWKVAVVSFPEAYYLCLKKVKGRYFKYILCKNLENLAKLDSVSI